MATRRPRKKQCLENAEESANTALALADKTTIDGTKENYKGKQRIMIEWLKVNHPSCMNQRGELKIPVPHGPILAFFGSLANDGTELSKCTDGEPTGDYPMSVSCIR